MHQVGIGIAKTVSPLTSCSCSDLDIVPSIGWGMLTLAVECSKIFSQDAITLQERIGIPSSHNVVRKSKLELINEKLVPPQMDGTVTPSTHGKRAIF
jgi:hypothetical protein